jgi:uncharacterized protein YraI
MAKKPAKAKPRWKFSASSMLKLPRLRWLVVGAVAAGAWAMTQEPPKREHWQRQRAVEQASIEKKPAAPVVAVAPEPKPAELVTASIPRPERPVAPTSVTMRTTEKVRLRKEASTSSAVVATLKGGQTVEASTIDGKWRKVSADGMVGWVHGDYLKSGPDPSEAVAAVPKPTPAVAVVPKPAPQAAPADSSELAFAPRPKQDVAPEPEAMPAVTESEAVPAAVPVSLPEDKSMWGALRPARAPQGGDCQCPYDLMLNGKQCGERSAYARGKGPQCYF